MTFRIAKVNLAREVREHYSDIYLNVLENIFHPSTTTLLVAPTGTGKTYTLTNLALRIMSGIGGIVEKCRKIRAVHIAVPTHLTLSDIAEKMRRSFIEAVDRGLFAYSRPRLLILRGSIVSCIDDNRRRLFEDLLRELARRGLDIRETVRLLMQLEAGRLDRKIGETLLEYAKLCEVKMTLSTICSTCPKARNSRELLEKFVHSDLDVLDSLREEAEKTIAELGVDACPYRALTQLLHYDKELREIFTTPYILCTTHSMKLNIEITPLLEQRLAIAGRSGRAIPEIDIIDEADMPILAPPVIRLPIHFANGMVTIDEVRRRYSRYAVPSRDDIYSIRRLAELTVETYNEIGNIVRTFTSPYKRASEIVKVVHKLLNKIAELHPSIISKARTMLRKWKRGVLEKISDVDVEDLAVMAIVEKLVGFFYWVRKLELHLLPPHVLGARLQLGALVASDPSEIFNVEVDTRLKIGKVEINDIAIPLFEHAYRIVLDPSYPYAVRGKIGLTATLSRDWLRTVESLLSPPHRDAARRRIINIVDIYVRYINVRFWRGIFWLTWENYENILARKRSAIEQALSQLGESRQDKRKKMMETASSHFARTGLDVTMVALAEAERVGAASSEILYIFGTRGQVLKLAEAAALYYRKVRRTVTRLGTFTMTAPPRYDGENGLLEIYVQHDDKLYKLDITYARGRYGRGVDLEQYDTLIFMSPPLRVPLTLYRLIASGEDADRLNYVNAAIATVQATFRIVRRVVYRDRRKNILFDVSLLDDRYMKYYPGWFRFILETACRDLPALRTVTFFTSLG